MRPSMKYIGKNGVIFKIDFEKAHKQSEVALLIP
jgi:hypothetical protein